MSNRRKRHAAPIDRAMLLDQRYFREHPEADRYVRPAIIGEAPADVRGLLVEVDQVRPGFRMRYFFRPDHELIHDIQDMIIEQNACRIKTLEVERERLLKGRQHEEG